MCGGWRGRVVGVAVRDGGWGRRIVGLSGRGMGGVCGYSIRAPRRLPADAGISVRVRRRGAALCRSARCIGVRGVGCNAGRRVWAR